MQPIKLRHYLGLSASAALLLGNSAWAAQTIEYDIRWSTADSRYHVYMRPTTTPTPDLSLTSQVTIKVPHGTGGSRFVVTGVTSAVADTIWSANSRSDAPTGSVLLTTIFLSP